MRILTVLLLVVVVLVLAADDSEAATASCYGPGLFGNRMANGGVLTRSTLGVAHRTLPLGTRLLVRYRKRRVVVTVTDRGPFVASRAFDVTERVARRLGYRTCTAFGVRRIRTSLIR